MGRVVFTILACSLFLNSLALAEKKEPSLSDRIRTDIAFIQAAELVVNEYRIHGGSHAYALPALEQYANRQGVPVYRLPLMDPTYLLGLTFCPMTPEGRRCIIILDQNASANGQVSTLIHELAHMKLRGKSTHEAEAIAETVAYLVCQDIGLDTRRESISYLMHIPDKVLHETLTKRESAIRALVKELAAVAKRPAVTA